MKPAIFGEVAKGFLQSGGYATSLHFLGEVLLAFGTRRVRKIPPEQGFGWILWNFLMIMQCNGASLRSLYKFMIFDAAPWWFLVIYRSLVYVKYHSLALAQLKSPAGLGPSRSSRSRSPSPYGCVWFPARPVHLCFPAKMSWPMRFRSLGMVGNSIRTIFI